MIIRKKQHDDKALLGGSPAARFNYVPPRVSECEICLVKLNHRACEKCLFISLEASWKVEVRSQLHTCSRMGGCGANITGRNGGHVVKQLRCRTAAAGTM